MRKKNQYFKHILSLLMFGSNGIVASYITLGSVEIVFYRSLLGSIFLAAVFLFSGSALTAFKNKKHLLFLIVSGISMGASWMFLFEAYTQIGVSISILLYYCGPVFVMALSPILFRERLGVRKLIGFAAVLFGMICVNSTDFSEGKVSWGIICGVLSALTYAVMVIFNKKAESITGLENSLLQLITALITVFVFMLARGMKFVLPFENGIVPILILGFINTGLGCYLYFSSIQSLPAATVAICGYTEPLSAVIFAAVFLGERMAVVQIAGAVLIIGGALFAEAKILRKDRPKFLK